MLDGSMGIELAAFWSGGIIEDAEESKVLVVVTRTAVVECRYSVCLAVLADSNGAAVEESMGCPNLVVARIGELVTVLEPATVATVEDESAGVQCARWSTSENPLSRQADE